MENKNVVIIAVLAALVIAGVGVYMIVSDDGGETGEPDPYVPDPETYQDGLAVKGNANNDWYIDDKDVEMIQWIIDREKTIENYPLADANNDGVIDAKDIDAVKKIINREPTTLYHINYHDANGDGTMDMVWAETKFPANACLITGSNNICMNMFALGILDQVKGACYGSSLDAAIYGDCYMNEEKTAHLGTKSTTIEFEDGNSAASDVIKKEGVTVVVSDWNRTYLKNQDDFEKANVDVVRITSGSTKDYGIVHSNMLLGLLFGDIERAAAYTQALMDVVHYVDDAVSDQDKPLVVTSSYTGDVSSRNSDYTKCSDRAGSKFALRGIDFGSSSSIKLKDHPEILEKQIDYIVHLRSSIDYSQTAEGLKADWDKYTSAFSTVKDSDKNQIMVSGSIPMALRIAYVACGLHSDVVDQDKVDSMHQDIVNKFFNGKDFDVKNLTFLITSGDYAN